MMRDILLASRLDLELLGIKDPAKAEQAPAQ